MKSLARSLSIYGLMFLGSSGTSLAADLQSEYSTIRKEAEALSGETMDIPTRAVFHYNIYEDSKKNHTFPLIALHGALWGYQHTRHAPLITDLISLFVSVFDRKSAAFLNSQVSTLIKAYIEVNRSVFIDTYTNYYFTKTFGREAGADQFISPPLLRQLNRVHAAARAGITLSDTERREIYQTSLNYEQETLVAEKITKATADFKLKILKIAVVKPIVHFKYFPKNETFHFDDFSSRSERVKWALRSYDIATQVGWPRVEESMKEYGTMEKDFFHDPETFSENLKQEILQPEETLSSE